MTTGTSMCLWRSSGWGAPPQAGPPPARRPRHALRKVPDGVPPRPELRQRMPDARQPAARLGAPFWSYWSASVVSATGNGTLSVALPLLAAGTGDPVLVSLTLLAQRLPWLLFGLPAGALADRLP